MERALVVTGSRNRGIAVASAQITGENADLSWKRGPLCRYQIADPMIRNLFLYMLPAFLAFAAGCGGDSAEADPERKTLPVPDVTYSVSGRTATVRWSISAQVEAVRFVFELYAGRCRRACQIGHDEPSPPSASSWSRG